MRMNRLEILRKARDLLARPGGWVRGFLKDRSAGPEPAYCSLGAIYTASSVDIGTRGYGPYMQVSYEVAGAMSELARTILGAQYASCGPAVSANVIAGNNDGSTASQQRIVDLFDRTIERLEQEFPRLALPQTPAPVEAASADGTEATVEGAKDEVKEEVYV